MVDHTNDNADARARGAMPEPDAHGRAALLLVESLIHALVARRVISTPDAVDAVELALEVKAEIAADLGDSPETMRRSLTLLGAIRDSLQRDDPTR